MRPRAYARNSRIRGRRRSGGTSGTTGGSPGAYPTRSEEDLQPPARQLTSQALWRLVECLTDRGLAPAFRLAHLRLVFAIHGSRRVTQPGRAPHPEHTVASRPPDPRRDRRRLRRHRHEPALRACASASTDEHGVAADARQRAGRAVADLLVADADHLGQVHPLRDARRQQRRRGHPRAAGAGRAVAGRQAEEPRDARRARACSAPRCSTATA